MLLWGLTKGTQRILKISEYILDPFLFPKYCNFNSALFWDPIQIAVLWGMHSCLENKYLYLSPSLHMFVSASIYRWICIIMSVWMLVSKSVLYYYVHSHLLNRWNAMFSSKTYVYSRRINLFVTKCTFFSYHIPQNQWGSGINHITCNAGSAAPLSER